MTDVAVVPVPANAVAPDDLELVTESDDLMTGCSCSASDDNPY